MRSCAYWRNAESWPIAPRALGKHMKEGTRFKRMPFCILWVDDYIYAAKQS
jgi:hypothetical protein